MKTVEISKCAATPEVNSVWEKTSWKEVSAHTLNHYMGSRPGHFPTVEWKAVYDDEAVHVIFRVEDRYVLSRSEHYQDPVCKDSCVEFFFNPYPDHPESYFNLEINCGGVALFEFHEDSEADAISIPESDFDAVTIAHSMPKRTHPEVEGPVTWTVELRLPVEVLKKFSPVIQPEPGTEWRANFYKCADKSSHPHWLTWSPVDHPEPLFHLPESFGVLKFV